MKLIIAFFNLILLLNHLSAQWQTYLLSYMQVGTTSEKNIKVGLSLTQTQFGIITGTAFTFTNGFMGLVWGHLSDKYNRKWPIVICTFLFTFFSVLISFCDTYWQVLLSRVAFAIFMSSNVPISVSLICDYVIPAERGRAQSIYACGMYLGVGLSSLSELLDEAVGWRAAIRWIGLVCAAFGVLQLFLVEPKRNQTSKELVPDAQQLETTEDNIANDDYIPARTQSGGHIPLMESEINQDQRQTLTLYKEDANINLWEKVKLLFRNRCFLYLTIASFFRFFGGYSLGFLSATFFIHKYEPHKDQYAYMASVIVIGGGLPSSFMGGWLSDKYESRYPNIKGLIAGVGALAATPFIVITYIIQPPFWWAVASYYLAYFIAEMWYGPAHAQINNLFPSQFQGFACAVFNMSGTIAGTIATAVVSKLYQVYDPEDTDPQNAGYILGGAVLFSYFFCGPFFILSGNEYKKEYLRRQNEKIKQEFIDTNVSSQINNTYTNNQQNKLD